jgi:hypothetical protein
VLQFFSLRATILSAHILCISASVIPAAVMVGTMLAPGTVGVSLAFGTSEAVAVAADVSRPALTISRMPFAVVLIFSGAADVNAAVTAAEICSILADDTAADVAPNGSDEPSSHGADGSTSGKYCRGGLCR